MDPVRSWECKGRKKYQRYSYYMGAMKEESRILWSLLLRKAISLYINLVICKRTYTSWVLYQDAGKFQAAFATIMSGNMDALKKPEKKKEERKEKKDIKEKKDVPA
jgi:hypothetical protein